MVEDGGIILMVPGEVQLADPETKCLSAVAPAYILFMAMVETHVKL